MIGGMWGRRGRVNDNARGLMGKQGDPLAIHCDERLRCLEHPSRGGADGGQASKCRPAVRSGNRKYKASGKAWTELNYKMWRHQHLATGVIFILRELVCLFFLYFLM